MGIPSRPAAWKSGPSLPPGSGPATIAVTGVVLIIDVIRAPVLSVSTLSPIRVRSDRSTGRL